MVEGDWRKVKFEEKYRLDGMTCSRQKWSGGKMTVLEAVVGRRFHWLMVSLSFISSSLSSLFLRNKSSTFFPSFFFFSIPVISDVLSRSVKIILYINTEKDYFSPKANVRCQMSKCFRENLHSLQQNLSNSRVFEQDFWPKIQYFCSFFFFHWPQVLTQCLFLTKLQWGHFSI